MGAAEAEERRSARPRVLRIIRANAADELPEKGFFNRIASAEKRKVVTTHRNVDTRHLRFNASLVSEDSDVVGVVLQVPLPLPVG